MNRPALRRRALLIHTETYQNERFEDLPSTRADTWQMQQVLAHRNIGAFEARVSGDLAADDMRAEIAEFLESCEQDELALLYLSGHGARAHATTGEFYFVAADTDYDRVAETGVSAGFVNERLEECWAPQKVAMLDCCLSGGFTLGFRTADGPEGAAKSAAAAPLNSRGVYVLSSSGPIEESFSGSDVPDGPNPSVFTGAVVEALRTGRAATDASGNVSVEDLIEHVTRQLRGRGGQVPTRSSLGVNDRIVIASCPVGEAPALAPLTRSPQAEPHAGPFQEDGTGRPPKGATTWKQLIEYYRACVLDENSKTPYVPVAERGRSYACLTGAEHLISGDLDEHGTAEVPDEVVKFLEGVDGQDELWAGYPAVVLTRPRNGKPWTSPRFAPLLMRRVEVTEAEDGGQRRFRPYGPVVPHPGLANDQLGEEQASHLIDTYQPTWHAGQHGRLATDAGNLLQQDFEIACVQELRPDFLEDRIDTNTPGDGARNAAVLIRVPRDGGTSTKLLKDLDYIAGKSETIANTAMGALLIGADDEPTGEPGTPVTPLPANEAQLAVLRAAMSQRLTVATGPPGTGKSQLVANAVATALTDQQSVLVASTNNQAVDEVWQRCDRLLPDSLVRTGSSSGEQDYRQHEVDALERLLKSKPSDTHRATLLAELTKSTNQQDRVRRDLVRKAEVEEQLLDAAIERERHAADLGHTADSLAERLGSRPQAWAGRARRLGSARFFGAWCRARLLRKLGFEVVQDARAVCQQLADFAAAEIRWRGLRPEARSMPSDGDLTASLDAADAAVQDASLAVWQGVTADSLGAGKDAIRALSQDANNWWELKRVLRHVRGWATTSLSARRFPTSPQLFDLVIIDEASQCSIPQVLPLLFRARRALVIGDVMQLPHIATIPAEREALIRRSTGVGSTFLEKHHLSFRRHSAFHAAYSSCGGSLLLDEHYRCHPDIAAVSNELFYGGALTVLTDVRGRPAVSRPAVAWSHAEGRAEQPSSGTSWINLEEIGVVQQCVDYLLAHLPENATIGVVTPFKAQQTRLKNRLREDDRVRVGTVHTFQGGERDAVVFSLVAGDAMSRGAVSWVTRELNLWNVAMTRARSHLIMVGDKEFWRRSGGTGGELVRAAEEAETSANLGDISPDALAQKLYELTSEVPGTEAELGSSFNGHSLDALLRYNDGTSRPVLLDRGNGEESDPARHLRLMLRRRALLSPLDDGTRARRLPGWTLYDQRAALAELGLNSPYGIDAPRA